MKTVKKQVYFYVYKNISEDLSPTNRNNGTASIDINHNVSRIVMRSVCSQIYIPIRDVLRAL